MRALTGDLLLQPTAFLLVINIVLPLIATISFDNVATGLPDTFT